MGKFLILSFENSEEYILRGILSDVKKKNKGISNTGLYFRQ